MLKMRVDVLGKVSEPERRVPEFGYGLLPVPGKPFYMEIGGVLKEVTGIVSGFVKINDPVSILSRDMRKPKRYQYVTESGRKYSLKVMG
jgi:hypothetical protein